MSEPPTVRIVRTERGSRVEPPFDDDWTYLEKLQWRVAVLRESTGYTGQIEIAEYATNVCILLKNESIACDYHYAWQYLGGIEVGLKLANEDPA